MKIGKTMYLLAACALGACAGCHTVTPPPPPPPPPPPVYKITPMTMSPDAAKLADGITSDVRGALLQRGYPVVLAVPQDTVTPVVNVSVAVDRRETSRLDVWRVYEGSVVAKVTDTGVLCAEKTFKATGKRADTEQDAEAGVRSALSAELDAWLGKVLPRTLRK